MKAFWRNEFKNAWSMLCEKLYLVDGYNYGKERGMVQYDKDGNEIDSLTEMISLKAEIEKEIKSGNIGNSFQYYTTRIYGLLGINE